MSEDPEITDPRDPHKRRDILAELDRWLDEPAYVDTRERGREIERASMLIRAARVEIIALRRTIRLGPDLPALARDEALEEAAGLCELSAEIMQPDEQRLSDAIAAVKSCAAAIRALKEKR